MNIVGFDHGLSKGYDFNMSAASLQGGSGAPRTMRVDSIRAHCCKLFVLPRTPGTKRINGSGCTRCEHAMWIRLCVWVLNFERISWLVLFFEELSMVAHLARGDGCCDLRLVPDVAGD